MRRIVGLLGLLLVVMVAMTSCDSWLEGAESEASLSNLTEDVDFEAESVVGNHFSGVYASYKSSENFFLEFVGAEREGVKDVLVLDLIAPQGTKTIEGEYVVGYQGDYIALSRYDVVDQTTGMFFSGGSFYAEAIGNRLTDYMGFLTEGRVTISRIEEGNYQVVVDAKSELHTVKMTYSGTVPIRENGQTE